MRTEEARQGWMEGGNLEGRGKGGWIGPGMPGLPGQLAASLLLALPAQRIRLASSLHFQV